MYGPVCAGRDLRPDESASSQTLPFLLVESVSSAAAASPSPLPPVPGNRKAFPPHPRRPPSSRVCCAFGLGNSCLFHYLPAGYRVNC